MKRMDPEVEREVRRLAAKGHGLREIGRMLGCSRHAVTNTLRRESRLPRPTAWKPGVGAAVAGRARGDPGRPRARRHVHGHRCEHRAGDVDGVTRGQRQRRPERLSSPSGAPGGRSSSRGGRRRRSWPARAWPPRSPSGWRSGGRPRRSPSRLRMEFPDDPMMWVSHETIYHVAVRRGPWRAATRAVPLPAHRPGAAPAAQPDRDPGQDPGHGDDLRASRRGRTTGPCPATGKGT